MWTMFSMPETIFILKKEENEKDILEKEERFNKMKEAKLCGTCYFYDSNGFCDNAKSLDDCADRDSDRTCDNGQYKYDEKRMNNV